MAVSDSNLKRIDIYLENLKSRLGIWVTKRNDIKNFFRSLITGICECFVNRSRVLRTPWVAPRISWKCTWRCCWSYCLPKVHSFFCWFLLLLLLFFFFFFFFFFLFVFSLFYFLLVFRFLFTSFKLQIINQRTPWLHSESVKETINQSLEN